MGVLGMEGEGSGLVREGGCRRRHRRFWRVGDVMERRVSRKAPVASKHEREALWALERPNRKNTPCMARFFCSAGEGMCWWGWGCVGEVGDVLVRLGACW